MQGKCISLTLAVPAAKLYIREVNKAISIATKNSRSVPMKNDLREEIEHWRFLDDWEGFVPWRSEKHLQVEIPTDASLFRWGAVVGSSSETLEDFFSQGDTRPIHIKEADALFNTLTILESSLRDRRVDARVDNKAFVAAWEGQGCRCAELNNYTKSMFELTQRANIDLKLYYIPSECNPADKESRKLSLQDCMLSSNSWGVVEEKFGPHTIDLMALDSNAMVDHNGDKLRHFTPSPSISSAGVNMFAQDVSSEINPYVFPPFCMVSAALKFLAEQQPKTCTFVYPRMHPTPLWWPLMQKKYS